MGLHALWHACRTINLYDLLDMAVVSVFIYVILRLFEWTKAAATARGILLIGFLYLLARQLGMVLTTWFLHGFFAVFIIAIVIIFQEELRRFFERLSVWSARPSWQPFQSTTVEILVRCISQCAHERTGMLLVLRGRDPLDRHLEGGNELDGKLSDALLLSIFDVHSDGHDGAVIVEGGRLRTFGAHLPLSKNLQALSGLGTRHAAALGLAEVSDALCIVVSEQKGTIRIAQAGELKLVAGPNELARYITTFLNAEGKPTTGRHRWLGVVTRNKTEKFGALVLSFVLWLVFVQGFKPETKTLDLAIVAENIPDGLHLARLHPRRIAVTVSGLKRDLDPLDARRLHVHLDLYGEGTGAVRVEISDEDLRLPSSVHFIKVDPAAVDIDLQGKLLQPAS